ncbi:MAG TPA: exodeoxyribonuclease III, partial [Saprospiraceae bacterium]|nr:exodeoxyribonuclease III [Saprospiraceae bacterium]
MKIFSWNVNGVRAAVGKAFLAELAASEADIYCIQETKAQEDQVLSALLDVKDYHIYANSAERKGYSGVAILTKEQPLSVTKGIGIVEHDQEGRVLTLEFTQFYMVNVYVP